MFAPLLRRMVLFIQTPLEASSNPSSRGAYFPSSSARMRSAVVIQKSRDLQALSAFPGLLGSSSAPLAMTKLKELRSLQGRIQEMRPAR